LSVDLPGLLVTGGDERLVQPDGALWVGPGDPRGDLALDIGLLRAGGTVTAGPALATWPPDDPDILAAWLDGLLTVSGSETGSPWDRMELGVPEGDLDPCR
jgi:hypothetical protein